MLFRSSYSFIPSLFPDRCPSLRCEKLELLGDKQVQAEKGSKHGSWDLGEDDHLSIVWHFQGVRWFDDIAMHEFHLRKHGSLLGLMY